jgi:6-phosphogluconolactonase
MLTQVPGSPFPAGTQPEGLAVVSSANLLFVANNGSSDISAFKFDATTSALTPVPGSPFTGVAAPMGAATDISGKFLYVTNLSSNAVSAFTIDSATGTLAAVAGSPFATGSTPIGLTADPNGMFIYVADHMSDAVTPADTISPFSTDPATGALRPLGPLPILQPNCSSSCHVNPLRIVTHPTGKFAYSANVGANTLSAFSLSNGAVTTIAGPVPTGQHPFGVALDPSGSFLYVVNKLDNNISAFSVNSATGMVSPLAGAPFATGGNGPVGIVIVAGH